MHFLCTTDYMAQQHHIASRIQKGKGGDVPVRNVTTGNHQSQPRALLRALVFWLKGWTGLWRRKTMTD